MQRSRRKPLERLVIAQAYRCAECRSRVRVTKWRSLLDRRYVCCPRCKGHDVQVLPRIDPVEHLDRHLHRFVHKWLGAPLFYCRFCRLQFFDRRPRSKDGPLKKELQPASEADSV